MSDTAARPAGDAPAGVFDGARFALSFLTVVPVAARDGRGAAAAPAFFPLVGAAVGAAAGGVDAAAQTALSPFVAGAFALVALAAITGGLHLDGLADCADGLGVRGDRERRLQIMRDPATGSFGTLALVGWALLACGSLAALDGAHAVRALVAAAAAGRWAALVQARLLAPARRDGLGASFRPATAPLLVASVVAVAAVVLVLPTDHLAAALVAVVVALAAGALGARRLVGGYTGDTLGMGVVLTELAVLVAAGG